jgi:hypothetical protein
LKGWPQFSTSTVFETMESLSTRGGNLRNYYGTFLSAAKEEQAKKIRRN